MSTAGNDTAERQALLEIVGLIELHALALPDGKARGLLQTTSLRLGRYARKQWGETWAADAITDHDPGGRVFHLRDDQGSAFCFGGDDDDGAMIICGECAAAHVELERWSRSWRTS